MDNNEHQYLDLLHQSVYEKISAEINNKTIEKVIKTHLRKAHIKNKTSIRFQNYYFTILTNEGLLLNSSGYFKQFRKKYSLRGIDNKYLDHLEHKKAEILQDIQKDKLTELYFKTFRKAEIKHGNGVKQKNLGSFFSKLVHTFRPNDYCALDNPIKRYFGLQGESFFIAFLVISHSYKLWAKDNNSLLKKIREEVKKYDTKKVLQGEQMTDLKLLDLIFWSKAQLKS